MQVTGQINLQAWMSDPETWAVMDALVQEKGEALFVGGCVRDSILNRPVYDIDIATILKPEEVIQRMKLADITVIPTGIDHGTVTAIVDKKPFEITTLRCDITTNGRHAEIAYTDDYIEDAKRRDFTMNAIFCDLEGNLYDPFGGVQDLHQGIIRFVGNPEERIAEDVLRILRYYRFLAGYGQGEPMDEAVLATQKMAHLIPNLSAERIQSETMKLLDSKNAAKVMHFLLDKDILPHWLPDLTEIAVLEALMRLEADVDNKSFPIRRMAALCPMGGDVARQISSALKLSNKDRRDLIDLTTEIADFDLNANETTWRRLTHQYGTDFLRNYILLSAARSGDMAQINPAYDLVTKIRLPDFQLRGQDIIKRGIAAGPKIGTYMRAVETWWIDQDFEPKRRACLDYLDDLIAKDAG